MLLEPNEESGMPDRRRLQKFQPTVTTGNILSIVATLFSVITAAFIIGGRLSSVETKVDGLQGWVARLELRIDDINKAPNGR